MPRKQVTVINTEYGNPYTIEGFSRFMRDVITSAGLPLDCQPHGLRKTLGRMLADAGESAHDIMATLGHTTLAGAEREADCKRAVTHLNEHWKNKLSQATPESWEDRQRAKGKQRDER